MRSTAVVREGGQHCMPNGDAAEFAEFVSSHARQLQRAAWLLTGDWGTAEDLVQAALTKTWQHWAGIRQPAARTRDEL